MFDIIFNNNLYLMDQYYFFISQSSQPFQNPQNQLQYELLIKKNNYKIEKLNSQKMKIRQPIQREIAQIQLDIVHIRENSSKIIKSALNLMNQFKSSQSFYLSKIKYRQENTAKGIQFLKAQIADLKAKQIKDIRTLNIQVRKLEQQNKNLEQIMRRKFYNQFNKKKPKFNKIEEMGKKNFKSESLDKQNKIKKEMQFQLQLLQRGKLMKFAKMGLFQQSILVKTNFSQAREANLQYQQSSTESQDLKKLELDHNPFKKKKNPDFYL